MATPLKPQFNKGPRNTRGPVKKEPDHRINEMITAPAVRVVGEGMEPTIYDTREALRMAYDQGLDLVEISPNAQPPVCKIIDYQKFNYEMRRHGLGEFESRKYQHHTCHIAQIVCCIGHQAHRMDTETKYCFGQKIDKVNDDAKK